MKRKTVSTLLVIQLIIMALLSNPALAAPVPPETNADSVLLADLVTGRILIEKNVESVQVPASLTKIMTLFIVFDDIAAGNISLDDDVYISEDAWSTEGSKMFILVGSKVKLIDLIKGTTVASGNDACVAIAEHVSGSVSVFVDRMNQKANDLGLSNTYFVDPHGLSDNNKVSARDIFVLVSAYLEAHPEVVQYHALKEFTYTPPNSNPIPQFNRNRLLWSYPGVYGLKTGFTTMAGFNMVALCERNGFSTIVIVLGSAKGKSIEQGEAERAELVTSVFDWAYQNYTFVSLEDAGTDLGKVRVWKGRGKWTQGIAPDGLYVTVEKQQQENVNYEVEFDQNLEAPVAEGDKIGEAVFYSNGEEIGRMDLVSSEDVSRGNIFRVIIDIIVRFFRGLIHKV